MSTAEEVQKLWEHNKKFFNVQPRKIRVVKSGSHHRAFFDGGSGLLFRNNTTGSAFTFESFTANRKQ